MATFWLGSRLTFSQRLPAPFAGSTHRFYKQEKSRKERSCIEETSSVSQQSAKPIMDSYRVDSSFCSPVPIISFGGLRGTASSPAWLCIFCLSLSSLASGRCNDSMHCWELAPRSLLLSFLLLCLDLIHSVQHLTVPCCGPREQFEPKC